jgi:hypothetical protein
MTNDNLLTILLGGGVLGIGAIIVINSMSTKPPTFSNTPVAAPIVTPVAIATPTSVVPSPVVSPSPVASTSPEPPTTPSAKSLESDIPNLSNAEYNQYKALAEDNINGVEGAMSWSTIQEKLGIKYPLFKARWDKDPNVKLPKYKPTTEQPNPPKQELLLQDLRAKDSNGNLRSVNGTKVVPKPMPKPGDKDFVGPVHPSEIKQNSNAPAPYTNAQKALDRMRMD